MGLEFNRSGHLVVSEDTLETPRPGVFAGGDVVTGPGTVIRAVAAGQKAATMMDRFVRGQALRQPAEHRRPRIYVAPSEEPIDTTIPRAVRPTVGVTQRTSSFVEAELVLSEAEAKRESRRCLRCDLEFTKPRHEQTPAH